MDILVIDRDPLTRQLLGSRLSALGHAVTAEADKNEAFGKIRNNPFGCILVDPAPLSDARPVVINIWKNIHTSFRPYLMLLSKTATSEESIAAFANDALNKPFSTVDVETKIGNAERLTNLTRWLAQEDNIHSGGGMVGKAAFNQLFLSAIDRSFRYAERSLLIFMSMINYDAIAASAGVDAAENVVAKLTEKMTFMRRQSDVIGRLSPHDFAIMLQRPQYESEPIDAFNRFCEALDAFHTSYSNPDLAPRIDMSLISLPQGSLLQEGHVPLKAAQHA